jgi:outer membrane protein assembly factor BamB
MSSRTSTVVFDLDDTICTYRRDQDELLAVAFDRLDVEPFFDGRTYLDRYDEFVEESDDVRTCGNAVSQPSRWSRIVIPHSAGNSPGTMQMSALTATSAFVPGRRPRSIGSNDGLLYTWEYPSMEFAHAFDAGEDVKAPIATYDGAAFFGSWDERVFRVDLASGTVDWTFETGGNVMSGAGIDTDSGTVYIGSHDQNCYALDAATGEEQWRFETDGWITGCPAVTSEHVVIGSYDGNLYALTKAGEEVWRAENEGQITAAPLVHDGAIYYTERATEEVSGGAYRLVPAG